MQEAPALQGDVGSPHKEGLPRAVGQGEEVITERSKNSVKINVTGRGLCLQKVVKTKKITDIGLMLSVTNPTSV